MRLKSQNGNALFFILIGIALFAALSFTVVRMSRSTSKMSAQDARLSAEQMLAFAEHVSGSVQAVMLQNGCTLSQVSFENGTVGGYTNASAPDKCKIFNAAGGGMSYYPPPSEAIDTAAAAAAGGATGALAGTYYFTGNTCVDGQGSGSIGSCASDGLENEELLLIVPFINAETCDAVNQILKRPGTFTDAGTSFGGVKFTGSLSDGYALGSGSSTTYPSGCYHSSGGNPGAGYHFYYVLQAN